MVVPLRSVIKSLFIYRIRITPRRIINLVKIYLSMMLSYILRRPVVWGYPAILMIELTQYVKPH